MCQLIFKALWDGKQKQVCYVTSVGKFCWCTKVIHAAFGGVVFFDGYRSIMSWVFDVVLTESLSCLLSRSLPLSFCHSWLRLMWRAAVFQPHPSCPAPLQSAFTSGMLQPISIHVMYSSTNQHSCQILLRTPLPTNQHYLSNQSVFMSSNSRQLSLTIGTHP